MDFFEVCGVRISAINLRSGCAILERWIALREKVYVCVAPVSTIVECQKDKKYLEIVNKADMVTPDGMPVVWVAHLKGYKDVDRTYGPDLLMDFCRLSQDKTYRHYFYGGSEETNGRLIKTLKNLFPDINIVGTFAPSYRGVGEREDKKILDEINRTEPDILWIGLGSPKQDYWMVNHREDINVPVMVGVGAAFDFLSGQKRQAPRWMQRIGLEWFFRLCCEPRRLWKRYLIGNTQFIFYLFRDFLRIKKPFNKG